MIKLLSIWILLLISIEFSLGQQSTVVNFGQYNQLSLCSDGWTDGNGNSIALLYNESGFMVGSFDQYFNTNWLKSFGAGTGTAGKIIELSNGDFFGYILQDTSGRGQIFKFDIAGNFQWRKQLNFTSNIIECLEFSSNQIAILARYGVTPTLAVFDTNGNLSFVKSISSPDSDIVIFRDITKTNDSNILLVTEMYGTSHNPRLLLTKMDSLGNVIWDKCFDYTNRTNYISNTFQSSSNDFYLIGNTKPLNTDYNGNDLLILKFDENGNYTNGRRFGNEFQDIGDDIEEDKDGNLVAIGRSKPVPVCGDNFMVISLTQSLDTNYTRIYGFPSGSGAFFSELHAINNSLYSFGHGSLWSGIGSSDGHFVLTDQSFNLDCNVYGGGLDTNQSIQLQQMTSPASHISSSMSITALTDIYDATILINDACTGEMLGTLSPEKIEVKVYPNPTKNQLFITSVDNSIDGIRIIDIVGNEVSLDINSINSQEILLNTTKLKAGIYIIEISINGTTTAKRFVVE